jgi:5-methylcytosine-specific restriction endonuclease McrA
LEANKKISASLKARKREEVDETVNHYFCKMCEKGFARKHSLNSHVGQCPKNPNHVQRLTKRAEEWNSLLSLSYNEVPERLRREKVFREQEGKCNSCGLSEWLGQAITLELEHKNGNHHDNSRENVELLCPNCHSMTHTWRGRNKNKGKSGKRVSDEEMIEALKTTTSIRQALLKVGLAAKGGNYFRAKRLIALLQSLIPSNVS